MLRAGCVVPCAHACRDEVTAGACSVTVAGGFPLVRGAYEIPLGAPAVQVSVKCA